MVPPVVERGSISKGAAPPARRRGRRPPPEELVEQRRNEIIEAAYEVFSTKGYTATGIADIAERLGIGHGTFYRYFKNKRDILDQVIDYGVERIVSAIRLGISRQRAAVRKRRLRAKSRLPRKRACGPRRGWIFSAKYRSWSG